jgi:hypothetical protein
VGFYQGLGFEVTADYALPDGGPHTWAMTRRPGSVSGRSRPQQIAAADPSRSQPVLQQDLLEPLGLRFAL